MKKLFTLMLVSILATGVTFASFPVKKEKTVKKESTISIVEGSDATMQDAISEAMLAQEMEKNSSESASSSAKKPSKSDDFLPLLLLWLFLGGFAAHRWYAGKPVGWNILFILTAGGCLVWAIIDLVHIIKDDFM